MFSEDEFRSRYRLSKDAVIYWVDTLRIELASATNRGLPIPPLLQFTAVLRFFATGSFQIVTGDLEGLSEPTVSNLIRKVSMMIARKKNLFIKFPQSREEISKEVQGFYAICQFPGVVGAIDCIHIKVQSPGGNDAELFRNRKVHDARIFENSVLGMRFERGNSIGVLLGDNGYPCKQLC